MFPSPKSTCYSIVFLFVLLSMLSCKRPLFVIHWAEKSRLICMNKKCLDKQEKINSRGASKGFEGFKNKKQVPPLQEKKAPRSRPGSEK
jgi:hypothetical protein